MAAKSARGAKYALRFTGERRESSSSLVLVLVLGVRDGRYRISGGTRRLSPVLASFHDNRQHPAVAGLGPKDEDEDEHEQEDDLRAAR